MISERRAKHIGDPVSASAPDTPTEEAPAERILFVCTGNVCRSPYMELLVAHALSAVGRAVEVESAGTAALEGHELSEPLARRLEERDIDSSGFSARQLTSSMASRAGLIVTAERAHRRVVSRLEHSSVPRTFTLLQLARLMEALGPSGWPTAGAGVGELVDRLNRARGSAGVGSGDDDIEDPWGRSRWAYRRAATHIETGLRPLIKYLVDVR